MKEISVSFLSQGPKDKIFGDTIMLSVEAYMEQDKQWGRGHLEPQTSLELKEGTDRIHYGLENLLSFFIFMGVASLKRSGVASLKR